MTIQQRAVQLMRADIDGINEPGACAQQDIRKAPGRGANIETNLVARVDAKMLERSRELHAAARNVGMNRRGLYARIGRERLGCLFNLNAVRAHEPGPDRGLRGGATRKNAAFHKQTIGAVSGQRESFFSRGDGTVKEPGAFSSGYQHLRTNPDWKRPKAVIGNSILKRIREFPSCAYAARSRPLPLRRSSA